MGLLRTLVIIAFIYFALKVFKQYVLPILGRYLMRKAQEKMQEQMQQQFQGKNQQQQFKQDRRSEGDVSVKFRPQNDKKVKNDSVGDYVDFEEVE